MEFAAHLKGSVDIVNVIGEYVRLRKAGARYTGLCPFHNEKTPSFSVHAGHQFYICFGCGAKGDVLKFVQEIEHVSFFEALKLLSERYGIPMPKRTEYSDPETKLRAAVYQMHEIAAAAFRDHLAGPSGAEARAYLAGRGVRAETAAEFGLGYSDRSGRWLLRALEKNFAPEQIEASGLVGRRDDGSLYDRFRNRLMFPIHNESGKAIAFGGRALDAGEPAKYINSSESPIYKKTYVLYNLHRAKDAIRKNGRAVLVEGYMDAMGVWASGIAEVVASCGTALTPQQVQLVKRHSTNIVVNFDPDAAGGNAAERSVSMLLEEGMHVRILQLDGGLDPDEYCKERGAESYRAQLDGAAGYFHWLADRARAKFGMASAEARVAGFQFLLPALQRLPDKIERLAVANELASYLGVEAGAVLESFRKSAGERREKMAPPQPEPVRPVEKILLNLLLTSREARGELIPQLKELPAVEQFLTRRIFQVLFSLHDSGGHIDFSEVHERLDEKERNLLAAAVFADETDQTSLSLEQGMACLAALQKTGRDSERAALKLRVKEAERTGNMMEALRLAGELRRVERN